MTRRSYGRRWILRRRQPCVYLIVTFLWYTRFGAHGSLADAVDEGIGFCLASGHTAASLVLVFVPTARSGALGRGEAQ